jgi:hypothetical protein
LHAGGRLDELAISAAFLVLWLAVKLAGRQPVQDEGRRAAAMAVAVLVGS